MWPVLPSSETRPIPTENCTVPTLEFVDRNCLPPHTGQPPFGGKFWIAAGELSLSDRSFVRAGTIVVNAIKAPRIGGSDS